MENGFSFSSRSPFLCSSLARLVRRSKAEKRLRNKKATTLSQFSSTFSFCIFSSLLSSRYFFFSFFLILLAVHLVVFLRASCEVLTFVSSRESGKEKHFPLCFLSSSPFFRGNFPLNLPTCRPALLLCSFCFTRSFHFFNVNISSSFFFWNFQFFFVRFPMAKAVTTPTLSSISRAIVTLDLER